MNNELIEKLSDIEHKQWMEWTKAISTELHNMRRDLDEALDHEAVLRRIDHLLQKWSVNWIPYNELPDDIKEFDRIYARKVVSVLMDVGVKGHDDFSDCVCIELK